jgi:hypothetical protein
MHVDVDAVFACQREHAFDLAGVIGVVARRRADDLCAAFQSFDQQRIGAGIVGEPFLREHTQLDVDRPFVRVDQRLHAFEAAHPNSGVDLHMGAHARRAMLDAVLQGFARATVNVLRREGLLRLLHALDGIRHALGLGAAAVDDARLVEMDVGLDQPPAAQEPLGIVGGRVAHEVGLDRRNAALREADVGERVVVAGDARIADDGVDHAMTR